MPVKVRTKLLIAFVGTSVLLVAVGLLGQVVLGQSNDRVGSLGSLARRASAYGQLQQKAQHVRELLSGNAGAAFGAIWNDPGRKSLERVDGLAADAADRVAAGTAADRLGFTPPPEDREALGKIADTARRLERKLLEDLIPLYDDEEVPEEKALRIRANAEELASDLSTGAAALSNRTTDQINQVIARNASSFARSRALFIGVAAGAIVLALLLGFILSWSLIGPIQRIDTRLAAIASGNFSGHVEVDNRAGRAAMG